MTEKIFQTDNSEYFIRKTYDALIERGFLPISIPILQNADQFLDTVGERSRSELFFIEHHDPNANALRYDVTLPIAAQYLKNTHENARPESKIVTKGNVFRRRSLEEKNKKTECYQIGIEYIGHTERTKTDAECLAATLDMLSVIKDTPLKVEIADIGLSRAICEMPIIPPIKSGRLRGALRYREKFIRLLQENQNETSDNRFAALAKLSKDDAEKTVEDIFRLTNLNHTGIRTPHEITQRFVKKSEELQEQQLDQKVLLLLARFYDLQCPAEAAADKIHNLLSDINPDIDDYLQYYQRRLDILRSFSVDTSQLIYGPLVNRKPEYYSGFMFSIDHPDPNINNSALAGGGRYDDLFQLLGAPDKIPAVGAEIRPFEVLSLIS